MDCGPHRLTPATTDASDAPGYSGKCRLPLDLSVRRSRSNGSTGNRGIALTIERSDTRNSPPCDPLQLEAQQGLR